MYFIGIDPGSKFTGLAIVTNTYPKTEFAKYLLHREYDDPVKLFCDLVDFNVLTEPTRIAIEDMIGTGPRGEDVKRTIEVIGYLRYRLHEYGVLNTSDLVVELVTNQARLAYVSLVPRFISGKDERSAAAHALALRERFNSCTR